MSATIPDGYYTYGWPGTGLGNICYCEHCRAEYRWRFNADLPEKADRADTNYHRWTDRTAFTSATWAEAFAPKST
jgi:hypothetical protein